MVEIIAQNSFRKEIKRLKKKYRTIAQDFAKLLGELEKNPYAGADLGKGVRKVRMAVSAKGKGYREIESALLHLGRLHGMININL